jgi:hypothetical protein
MSPQELHAAIWQVLTLRDSSWLFYSSFSSIYADVVMAVVKKIEKTIGWLCYTDGICSPLIKYPLFYRKDPGPWVTYCEGE